MAYGSANTRLQQLAVMLRLEDDGSSEIDRGGLEALTLTQIVQRRPRIENPICCHIIANRCWAPAGGCGPGLYVFRGRRPWERPMRIQDAGRRPFLSLYPPSEYPMNTHQGRED